MLGVPEVVQDPRFASYALRKVNEEALIPIIERAVALRDVADIEPSLADAGLPVSRVNDYRQSLDALEMQGRGMVVEGEHARAGPVRMLRNPILFDSDGPGIERVAPLLGEHTEEVLRECGFADGEIAVLRDSGAFGFAVPAR